MTGTKTGLYEEVIKLTQAYFGPATHRFVNRQITNHLGKEPEQLDHQDLLRLIDWVSPAMALVTENQETVKRYMSELRALAEE
jgi:hypothetical protein